MFERILVIVKMFIWINRSKNKIEFMIFLSSKLFLNNKHIPDTVNVKRIMILKINSFPCVKAWINDGFQKSGIKKRLSIIGIT